MPSQCDGRNIVINVKHLGIQEKASPQEKQYRFSSAVTNRTVRILTTTRIRTICLPKNDALLLGSHQDDTPGLALEVKYRNHLKFNFFH